MNINKTMCATTDPSFAWKSIDWKKCEAQVKKTTRTYCKG